MARATKITFRSTGLLIAFARFCHFAEIGNRWMNMLVCNFVTAALVAVYVSKKVNHGHTHIHQYRSRSMCNQLVV